jgi:hypothetical protein
MAQVNDPIYLSSLVGLKTLKNALLRAKDIPDPTTRAMIMLDKLLMFTDLIQGAASVTLDNFYNNIPEDAKNKDTLEKQVTTVREEASITMKLLQDELNMLIKWVQNPVYSPNHPFGNHVMKQTEHKFNETFGLQPK